MAREQKWDGDSQPVTFEDDPDVSTYFFADMDGTARSLDDPALVELDGTCPTTL